MEPMPDPENVDEYIAYWRRKSPREIMDYVEKLSRFIYDNMTPEAREKFEKIRREESGWGDWW